MARLVLCAGTALVGYLVVGGGALGQDWHERGNAGTVPGPDFVGTTDNAALELKVDERRALRLEPADDAPNLIGGDQTNAAAGTASGAAIGGGRTNSVAHDYGVVAGGDQNTAEGFFASIGGGQRNATGQNFATVAGGGFNGAGGGYATAGGGQENEASGDWATIPGGQRNSAQGAFSFAAGRHARAEHQGSFVWADSRAQDFISTGNDQFLIKAQGGVGIGTNSPDEELVVYGGNSVARIAIDSGPPAANSGLLLRQGGTPRWSLATAGGGDLTIREDDAGADRLTIKGAGPQQGHLGLGTASPTQRLDIAGGSINAVNDIWFDGGANQVSWLRAPNEPDWEISVRDPTSNLAPVLAIRQGGRVGIGIDLPEAPLHIDHEDGMSVTKDGVGLFTAGTTTGNAGGASTFGPNGNFNVGLGNLHGDANAGVVTVLDAAGDWQAAILVWEDGRGYVSADVKSFRAPNPREPGTEIVYAAIEGPEAAAYVRGTARLDRGRAIVLLPGHFTSVASEQGITVQLTPHSPESMGLAVAEKSPERIVVQELMKGTGTYDFDWEVKSVRRGYEDYRVIQPAWNAEAFQLDEGAVR